MDDKNTKSSFLVKIMNIFGVTKINGKWDPEHFAIEGIITRFKGRIVTKKFVDELIERY